MIPNYHVLTENSASDDWSDYSPDIAMRMLSNQQEQALEDCGFGNYDEDLYLIHFFDLPLSKETTRVMTIYGAICLLPISDGVDFVEFEDGTYGFVSYYNGTTKGFEILADFDYPGLLWCYENGYLTNAQYGEYFERI